MKEPGAMQRISPFILSEIGRGHGLDREVIGFIGE